MPLRLVDHDALQRACPRLVVLRAPVLEAAVGLVEEEHADDEPHGDVGVLDDKPVHVVGEDDGQEDDDHGVENAELVFRLELAVTALGALPVDSATQEPRGDDVEDDGQQARHEEKQCRLEGQQQAARHADNVLDELLKKNFHRLT